MAPGQYYKIEKVCSLGLVSGFTIPIFSNDLLEYNGPTGRQTLPVIAINAYTRITGDVTNNIAPTETANRAVTMATPLVIRGCQDIEVNGHHLNYYSVGLYTGMHPIYINDVLATSSDFTIGTHGTPVLSGGVPTVSVGDSTRGAVPSVGGYFRLRTTKATGATDAVGLNGLGFALVGDAQYTLITEDGVRLDNFGTANEGDVFEVVVTPTTYEWWVAGVTVREAQRTVNYSASIGSVSNTATLPLGTPVNYNLPTVSGRGRINATFGTFVSRQEVDVIIPAKPVYAGSTTLAGTCPNPSVDLATLVDMASQTSKGVVTEFYTSSTPSAATRVTNTVITTNGTFYAFQRDTQSDCYSTQHTVVTVAHPTCVFPPVITNTWDLDSCSGTQTITAQLTGSAATLAWYRDNVLIAGQTSPTITVTQSGTYKLVATNSAGTAEHEDYIEVAAAPIITTQLPFNITINHDDTQTLTIGINNNGTPVTSVVWEKQSTTGSWTTVSSGTSLTYRPESGGTYRVRVTNKCGTVTSTTVNVTYIRATSIDDEYEVPINTPVTGNVSTNDRKCQGTINGVAVRTFYKLKPETLLPVGSGSITEFNENTGEFVFVPIPTFIGTVTFDYDIYCTISSTNDISLAEYNGTAEVSITVVCIPLADNASVVIRGEDEVVLGQSTMFVIDGLTGSLPYVYEWYVTNGTIIGDSNDDILVVTPTAHPLTVSVVVNNCSGVGSILRNREINVKVNCFRNICLDLECKIERVTNVIATLQGVEEENRVVEWNQKNVIFKTALGLHNYRLVVYGDKEDPYEIILKNISCK